MAIDLSNLNRARSGLNRYTGEALFGWDHVIQSLNNIFMQPYGQRVMREWVGSMVPVLLGRSNITPNDVLPFWQSLWVTIQTFEPGFAVTQIRPLNANVGGELACLVEGEYRPLGHLGNETAEGGRRIRFTAGPDGSGRAEALG